jgi:thioredoxin 1
MIRLLSTVTFLLFLVACSKEGVRVPPSPGVRLVQNATSSGLPTVAEFGAETCASCRQMRGVLDKVAHQTQGRAHVLLIDITKDWPAGEFFRIQLMPTQVFFGPDGREVWRHMGKLSEAEVMARLDVKH